MRRIHPLVKISSSREYVENEDDFLSDNKLMHYVEHEMVRELDSFSLVVDDAENFVVITDFDENRYSESLQIDLIQQKRSPFILTSFVQSLSSLFPIAFLRITLNH